MIPVLFFLLASAPADSTQDWPQWLGPQRDGVWRETGILDKFPEGGPKLLWKSPVAGGYAGPAVANGRVYVTDMKFNEGVTRDPNDFNRKKLSGKESIYCLDAKSGEVVWKHSYDCDYTISYAYGPRCTPLVHDGKVYALGAMGDLLCLSAEDGKVLWSHHFPKEFKIAAPTWGWSASPLLEGDKLICLVGGKGTTAVAFHKDTGKELWRALDSGAEPGYCPPVIYTLADKRQLIIWHPQSINGLDPETGKVFWTQPFAVKANLTVPMPRQLPDDRLFVTSFYNGPMMLQITAGDSPQAKVLWKGNSDSESRTDKLHSIMPTPFIQDEHIYGVCSYGQLRCLQADTGKRVWETFQATGVTRPARWANAFLVKHDESGRYFLFNEKGELIIAELTPKAYRQLDKAKLIEPTQAAMGRDIVWTHPAYAQRCIFVRNDQEIACYSLAK